MKVVIAVDDLHPEQGWGCEGDESVGYLEELNREYGCKFTLFIPSNYHDKYPLSENIDWVDWWTSNDWVELASHGHYHKVFKYTFEEIGEQEFLELSYQEAKERVNDILNQWFKVGVSPKGFRMPGWGCTQQSADAVSEYFDWVAQHDRINNGIHFDTNIFYGEDSINETDSLREWDGAIHFQSHIAGHYNKNNWTSENYETFRVILNYLKNNNNLKFVTFSELL